MKIHTVSSQIHRYRALSLGIHLSVLVVLGLLLRQISGTKLTAPHERPRMAHLVFSMPGSTESGSAKAPYRNTREPKTDSTSHIKPALPRHGVPSPKILTGNGVSGQTAWGTGKITIAFQKYFPPPQPDLSGMPRGTEGDVVLTAVIDDQGKIADLTLLAGLNPAIDNNVIQTVRSWTFTPATKDGLPVSSKQELHFHFRSPQNG